MSLSKKIAEEKDLDVKKILLEFQKESRRKAIGLALNSLALGLIVLGLYYNTSMPYFLVESHGALTGIFILGTVIFIRDARNNKRNP